MTECESCRRDVNGDAVTWTPAGAFCGRCLVAYAGPDGVETYRDRDESDGEGGRQSGLGGF
jgi:hypothetical protein